MPSTFSHLVFVDFENVPSVDLALAEGKPLHVTLLIGKNQKRLELALVRQIHKYATQVSLIEVGASGRNALDLVLAAHLGRATVEYPDAEFTIISGDHDFDPLVAHFSANRMRVSREPHFSDLPIFGALKVPAPTASRSRVAAKPAAPAKKAAALVVPAPNAPQEKMDRLITHLRAKINRPKTRISLLRYINTVFGSKLLPEGRERILNELLPLGIFTIPDGKKLAYSS